MKLTASHLVLLVGAAATVGAIAPEPSLMVAAHALLMVVGIQVVRVLDSSRA